jgi:hypothetical protein
MDEATRAKARQNLMLLDSQIRITLEQPTPLLQALRDIASAGYPTILRLITAELDRRNSVRRITGAKGLVVIRIKNPSAKSKGGEA